MPMPSSSSSSSLSLSFSKVSYKTLLTQDVINVDSFPFFRRIILPYIPCATLLYFSCYRSKWSFPSFHSTIFQNFAIVSDLFPEVTKLQHHTTLCTDCSTSLVSSLNIISIYRLKETPSFWILLRLWRSWNEFQVNNRNIVPIGNYGK